MVDSHDEEPDLSEDADQRMRRGHAQGETARRALAEMRNLLERRSRQEFHEELSSDNGDNPLTRFAKSSSALVAMSQ